MAVTRKTLRFLPGVFQTEANRKFLGSTLDQLVSEPNLKKINGYVGRKSGFKHNDYENYVVELSKQRQNYQLEVGFVEKTPSGEIKSFANYNDLVNQIAYHGGITNNQDRLFNNEYYSYRPLVDLDKLVNYQNYYWVPAGPEAVTLSSRRVSSQTTYNFLEQITHFTTSTTGLVQNPTITLIRGTTYTFNSTTYSGNLFIQSEPGTSGQKQYSPGSSSRQVAGVTNNGTGTITFTPPVEGAQDFFIKFPLVDHVEYALQSNFTSLDNAVWNFGEGMSTKLEGDQFFPGNAEVIFVNNSANPADWTDRNGLVIPVSQRNGIWRIDLIKYSGQPARMQFSFVRSVPESTRVTVNKGRNRGKEYYISNSNYLEYNGITGENSRLFYQHSNKNYYGIIELVDRNFAELNITTFLGTKNYTTPDGIALSNGMKVFCDNTVNPPEYRNKTYIVEGVGKSIRLVDYSLLISPEIRFAKSQVSFESKQYDVGKFDETLSGSTVPDYIVSNRSSIDLNAWARVNRWFHYDVIKKALEVNGFNSDFSNYQRAQRPIIEFEPDLELFNSGRIFAGFVDLFFDSDFRFSLNGASTKLVDAIPLINNAKFRDIDALGMGLRAGQRVVFSTDNNVEVRNKVYAVNYLNQIVSTYFDGLVTGTLTITGNRITGVGTAFVTELDIGTELYTSSNSYLGRVIEIKGNTELFLDQDYYSTIPNITGALYNHSRITLAPIQTIVNYDQVTATSGVSEGKSYYFVNNVWASAQQKIDLNQDILFDVVTSTNQSLSTAYTESTFLGTKVFSYKKTQSLIDSVLGFGISYSGNSDLSGDIIFENNFDADLFYYRTTNTTSNLVPDKVNKGFLRKITGRYTNELLNTYSRIEDSSKQFQHISAVYDSITNYFEIGTEPKTSSSSDRNLKVFVNNVLLRITNTDNPEYRVEIYNNRVAVVIDYNLLSTNDKIDILIDSAEPTAFGYYQIPKNLEINPFNSTVEQVSMGQLRNHLAEIGENNRFITGPALGISNVRDVDISRTSGVLIQHSASLLPAMAFLTNKQANFLNAIDYASREYTRFKNKFLDAINNYLDRPASDVPSIVDEILTNFSTIKNASFPWYYSDMVPYGEQVLINNHRISSAGQLFYTLANDFTRQPGNRAILVYVNDRILTLDQDYQITSNNILEILPSLNIREGDVLSIKEYYNTDGNYVPETPSKLGLYPRYVPGKLFDNSYQNDVYIIQGHDGSIIPAFNDIRDNLILELESRIYNNIKVDYNPALFNQSRYTPGKFRTTEYSRSEYNSVVGIEFLKWAGENQLDYSTNTFFMSNDDWTWNYSSSRDLDNARIPGYWRGIYKYYYDTDRPHTHPWEMLGFSIKPAWWDQHYSWTLPTQRQLLITAIEHGRIGVPGSASYTTFTNSVYARPGFANVVPVDLGGQLISPQQVLISGFDSNRLSGNFTVGDYGPIESAWARSSEYAFALQKAFALLKPARYFGLLFDTYRYTRNAVSGIDQYSLRSTANRISFKDFIVNGYEVGGEIQRAASYTNWISSYLVSLGIDGPAAVNALITDSDLNLAYKFAGFTDKKYINVLANQITINSTSDSIVIPEESYNIFLNRSLPIETIVYSAVIIERTSRGYSVNGYDQKFPFFTIIPSQTTGTSYELDVLGESVVIFNKFLPQKVKIPYGFEFANIQQVSDFLVSYQRYLSAQGVVFNTYDSDLGLVRDWSLSVREFITWAKQGWAPNNILVLSPVVDTISVYSQNFAVDTIDNFAYGSQLVGTNSNVIRAGDFTVLRDSKTTVISTISGQTIAFIRINLVQYEHVLILDNVTIFNDVIYKSDVGDRQLRIKLIGSVTAAWDGDLTPPGFIYSTGEVDSWQANYDYKKGEVVEYKSRNYTAIRDIIGSEKFNNLDWSQLDSVFRQGLLPNLSQNAAKFEDIYNIDILPVDESLVDYSSGLIGYRTRSYLNDLGISTTSQIKFYQGFIKEKGTRNAVTAFERATLNGIDSTIDLFEEWGARLGAYGAIDTNPEYRFEIKPEEIRQNPYLYQFLIGGQLPDNKLFKSINKSNLLASPLDYQPHVFLNRNVAQPKSWKIELFGDSVICGKEVEEDRYEIDIIKRHGYSIDVQRSNEYSIVVTGLGDQTAKSFLVPNQNFEIHFTSAYPNEPLFVTIESPVLNDKQLAVSSLDKIEYSSANNVVQSSAISINASAKNQFELLHVSIEPVLYPDSPRTQSNEGDVYAPDTALMGQDIFFDVTSVFDNEELYWTIEEVANNELPNTETTGFGDTDLQKLVCLNDKVSGRVSEPPDYLLYKNLSKDFDVAVLTRSVEKSSTISLLDGTDGVNGVWPDDIDADLVVINHGFNDARTGISLDTYRNNLRQLRNKLDRKRVIVWLSPLKIPANNPNNDFAPTGTNDLSGYAAAMREVALENGDYYADAYNYGLLQQYIALDGQHLTQQGYNMLVDKVLAPVVRQALEDQISSNQRYYEDDIHTAGYVTESDVDQLIFDISRYQDFDPALLANLTNGYKIWVAKDFDLDWQVYRAYVTPYRVVSARADLGNTLILVCDSAPHLIAGDMIAVRSLDVDANGFYQVLLVNGQEVSVTKTGIDPEFSVNDRAGQVVFLEKLRFKTRSQLETYRPRFGWIAKDPYTVDTTAKDLIYVDSHGTLNSWSIYQPEVIDYFTEISTVSNVTIANVYSIIGINCEVIDSSVNVVTYNDSINFCVFSEDESEELYYTIETPTAGDFDNNIQVGGENVRIETTQIGIDRQVYRFNTVKSANPVVDIESINNLYLYNSDREIVARLDLLDPVKGRILGTARAEIDIISSRDPAEYRNTDDASLYFYSQESYWAQNQVGTYWWNTDSCRFFNYEIDDLEYRRNNWGKLFPGSTIEVYEWVVSDVLPSVWVSTGLEGTPLFVNDEYYTDAVYLDPKTNAFKTRYYFWVRGVTNKSAGNKKLATTTVEDMILNPVQQGIPYLAALRDDAIALYNIGPFIKGDQVYLYLSSKDLVNEKIVHSDFALLQEGNPSANFPVYLETKLIDSIIGSNQYGKLVPDPELTFENRIGFGTRPLQTLIIDKQSARRNIIEYLNNIFKQYPVATRLFDATTIFSDNFFAKDPEPSTDTYNVAVDSIGDLYTPAQTATVMSILVRNDASVGGYWSVYERKGQIGVLPSRFTTTVEFIKKQSYDVTKLWSLIDWYAEGYDKNTKPDVIVNEFKDIYKLDLSHGMIVKVKNDYDKSRSIGNIRIENIETQGLWELYRFDLSSSNRFVPVLIGLEKKTIKLLERFYGQEGFDSSDFDVAVYDDRNDIELRYVLQGVKENIFINDLEDQYVLMLFALVNYILTEQKYIDWFFKTSFVAVKHTTKGLLQLASSIKNRQRDIESYIEEIKPYRTKIREFISAYENIELFHNAVTDFDLPPYYDPGLAVYRSPSGEYPSIDQAILQRPDYQEWVKNHKYEVSEIDIGHSGYGYQDTGSNAIVPSIEIFRSDYNLGSNAEAEIRLDNINFGISKTYVTNTGSNYTETPTVKLLGVGATPVSDRQRHTFVVTSLGYSYFQAGQQNKLGFGVYGGISDDNIVNNYKHSKINVADWVLGSGGTPTYPQNGNTNENQRVRDTDPWNNQSIVWENRPNGDGQADGGWNGAYFTIDPSKTYRSVVWMRRTTNDSGGILYHGLFTNGSYPTPTGSLYPTGSVRRLSDGLGEQNPYWNYRDAGEYNQGQWYLHVGFIFPASHTGTSAHPDSGIYTRNGGRVLLNNGNIQDCKFPANATQAMQRCYHYYSSDAYTRSQFAYPRFEEVDGTEPTIKDLLDYGPYYDVKYKNMQRGYHMHRVRRADGKVAFSRNYDLYSENIPGFAGAGSLDLVRDLNATTSDYVVIVHTYDEPSLNRFNNNLHIALQRCGASVEVFGRPLEPTTTFKYRSSYILVGIPGCGVGRGIEHYAGSGDNTTDAYCSVTFKIEKGYLAAISSDPKHYVFSYPFSLPANPVQGVDYSYGERRYVYDGFTWRGTKQVTSSLTNDREPRSAVLSLRLKNNTVRKIKSVLKFDRTQYTTKIKEFVQGNLYLAGSYLSYQGQAYFVPSDYSSGSDIDLSQVVKVNASEFDNANDRIMSFYVPADSQATPKDLVKLVPGISPLNPVYTGSTSQTPDTILLGDTFGTSSGLIAGNIRVDGGKFVDRILAHSPEELVPGYIYDSLSIRVLETVSSLSTTTTTTTSAPSSPMVFSLVTDNQSTVKVPYLNNPVETSESFTVALTGYGDDNLSLVNIEILEKPVGATVAITPPSFSLLPGQQKPVYFTVANDMMRGNVWYDLTAFNNNFALLDNSPTWSADVRGSMQFNLGSNISDRASSSTTVSGINTTPGGYNTVAMWMRWRSETNGFPMEWKTGYRLWMPAGTLGFNNGAGDLYGVSAASMSPYMNTWMFVTAVFHNTISGSTYVGYNKLYINGQARSLSQISPPATSGTAGIGITLANSTNPSAAPDAYEFDGDISEVFVYNRELTPTEVVQMYYATRDRYPTPPTTTTTTTTTSTTTTTTQPPAPPLPPGIPATNAAWGGNGFGPLAYPGTFVGYQGGYSAAAGHMGNGGGGSASPLGGNGQSWSSPSGGQGEYGTGASAGGYSTAGVAGVGAQPGYSSALVQATGVGNGGGGVETDGANSSTAPINGGDGTGGLLRITITSGSYTFTNADLTAFGATRLVDGGQGIEWDNSANANKRNSIDLYQYALTGTFTVPAGITKISVGIIAGGGGGATGPCVNAGGGGGGAGLLTNYSVTSGTVYKIKVGAGGQGGRQPATRDSSGGPPYGVSDAPWRGGRTAFCRNDDTEIIYATGGNTRPDNCAGVTNADSASANTRD